MSDHIPDKFEAKGVTYCLKHLGRIILSVNLSKGQVARVQVVFSDHCVAEGRRDKEGNIKPHCVDPDFFWTSPNRPEGYFCPTRYKWSLGLRKRLEDLFNNGNWKVCLQKGHGNDQRFFLWNDPASGMVYFVVFTLVKARNPNFDLIMRISSAYPLPVQPPFAIAVRFKLLIEKRIKGEAVTSKHASR